MPKMTVIHKSDVHPMDRAVQREVRVKRRSDSNAK